MAAGVARIRIAACLDPGIGEANLRFDQLSVGRSPGSVGLRVQVSEQYYRKVPILRLLYWALDDLLRLGELNGGIKVRAVPIEVGVDEADRLTSNT